MSNRKRFLGVINARAISLSTSSNATCLNASHSTNVVLFGIKYIFIIRLDNI